MASRVTNPAVGGQLEAVVRAGITHLRGNKRELCIITASMSLLGEIGCRDPGCLARILPLATQVVDGIQG